MTIPSQQSVVQPKLKERSTSHSFWPAAVLLIWTRTLVIAPAVDYKIQNRVPAVKVNRVSDATRLAGVELTVTVRNRLRLFFLGLEDDKFWKILSISVNGKFLPHWSKGLPAIQTAVVEESIELSCRRTTRIKGRTKRRWRVVGKQWQESWRTLLSKPFNHNRLGFGVVRCRVLRSIQQFSRYCAFVMSGHNQLNRADYRRATLMKFFFLSGEYLAPILLCLFRTSRQVPGLGNCVWVTGDGRNNRVCKSLLKMIAELLQLDIKMFTFVYRI